jgi:hypothetical protein
LTLAALPEAAAVHWRTPASERTLTRAARLWTLTTVAHVVPFLVAGGLLLWLQPLTFPVAIAGSAFAWAIPALYAARGANVVRRKARASEAAERRALGLLGDLVEHDARTLVAETGLLLERGHFGVWLLGEAGALLVRPGARRVNCYCIRVPEPDLPSGDRIAHLLLALRTDEQGFATVANLAFSGARWRVRRCLTPVMRPALDAAARVAITNR